MSQSRYSTVPSDAVCDERLSHVQLRVLLAIGSFTSKDKAAFPKQRTIADLLGVSRETVNRAIKVLRELGYVSVEHQQRDDGGQRESLYWVNLDPRDAGVTTPVIEADPCDAQITPPVIAYDHTPCDAIGSHLRTTHKNIPTEASASVVTASAPTAIPIEPKKAKGRVRGPARKHAIPPNWAPGVTAYAFASKTGLSREEINHEADQFRNSAAATGRTYADWDAAFRTWIGNTVKWRDERAARTSAGQNTSGKSRGGGLVAAGLRSIREARGYGESVPGERGMGAGDVLDGDQFRLTGS
jgi:biotin operon repressor